MSSDSSGNYVPSPVGSINSLAEFLGGFSDAFLRNVSNNSDHTSAEPEQARHEPKTLLFLFLAFGVGALARHLFKKTPIPYTVILICIGLAVGAVSRVVPVVRDFTDLASIDPHLMLYIFLPILVFESAFAMDVHTFKKTVAQSLVLAGPGMVISAVLTAVMTRYLFNYNWSWTVCLLFGAILSATDPVAVVALLKDLGASKQLGTVIEGESLLNDGAAIVLFNVLLTELLPNVTQTGLDIFGYLMRVVLVGPLFGWVMGKLTVLWLSHVFNDALIEITITLASTYITYFIGEAYCQVSGVLSVVTLGIEISSRKSNISPEVEKFLHRFWEMLGYLANTLIFILVGVVITQQAFFNVEALAWMYLVVLYFTLIVIRLIIVLSATPLLSKIGYDLTWKHGVVISWGGLRGAVGLALAMVVVQEGNSYGGQLQAIGSHFLFYTAGIVVLTLCVNGSTTGLLLRFLGMNDISPAKKLAMAQAVRRLQDAQLRAINVLKSDAFLADVDWDLVETSTTVKDPYAAKDKKPEHSTLVRKVTHCPQCSTEVPRVPHTTELAEIAEEVRVRTIKAEKTSYWRQFEQGMLGRDAVLILSSIADTALDTSERLILKKDIESYWRIPKPLMMLRSLTEKVYRWKTSKKPPAPKSRFLHFFYLLSTNAVVEGIIMGIIVVNIILTIVELVITDDPKLALGLQITNYFFVALYILETVMKMLGLRKYYWYTIWNIFDFGITIISILDTTVIDVAVPSIRGINPSIIRIVRLFRILRILRAGRLFRVIMHLLLALVDQIINYRLKFGYDIGKGFLVAKEEMLSQLDKLDFAHKEVVLEHKNRSEDTRVEVIRSLGQLRKDHAGVAQSVKTHQAIRSVLNHCVDTVRKMLGSGILDEGDARKLHSVLEVKMKKLNRTPATLPLPQPEVMLHNLAWFHSLEDDVVDAVVGKAELVSFDKGDVIFHEGAQMSSIYIIVSGLVKIFHSVELMVPAETGGNDDGEEVSVSRAEASDGDSQRMATMMVPQVLDLLSVGNVLGEKEFLTSRVAEAGAVCETDVQVYVLANSDVEEIPELKTGIWRSYGIRAAAQLLQEQIEYQDWSSTRISLLCEDSSIVYPPQGPAPASGSVVCDEHEAVVVLHGAAWGVNTREALQGPCLVPRTVHQILLEDPRTVLLVVPKIGSVERKSKNAKSRRDRGAVEAAVRPHVRAWRHLKEVVGKGFSFGQSVSPEGGEEFGGEVHVNYSVATSFALSSSSILRSKAAADTATASMSSYSITSGSENSVDPPPSPSGSTSTSLPMSGRDIKSSLSPSNGRDAELSLPLS